MSQPTFIRYGLLFSFFCTALFTTAQPVTLPREPSPAGSVSQTVGISTIQVDYSRPAAKGREIWGKLVPYGWNKQGFGNGKDAPWRAGANENTVLHVSHPATIEGQAVPAGEYGLFFVINADNSGEVILSKDYKSWGSFFYDSTKDLFRAKIKVRDLPYSVERLTYTFDSVSKTTAELDLNWGKKQFPVRITFAVDDIVMANAAAELNGQTGFFWQSFNGAANYSLANQVNIDQGLKWANQATLMTPGFAPVITKAGLLDLSGKHAESEKLMQEAMKNASEGDLNAYGYQLLGLQKFDKAIETFIANTKNHPGSANVWDSLGEGYALAGDKKNAIINFKKSLTLNPTAPTKANSEKYLKQLGAM